MRNLLGLVSACLLLLAGAVPDDELPEGLYRPTGLFELALSKLHVEGSPEDPKSIRVASDQVEWEGEAERKLFTKIEEYKGEIFKRNYHGQTPIHVAAAHGLPEVLLAMVKVAWMLTATTKKQRDEEIYNGDELGRTPMHMAVLADNNAGRKVQILAENDLLLDPLDKRGQTPLHVAADLNKTDALLALLVAGASKNKMSGRGQTAMHYAARKGNVRAIEALIKAGASVNVQDPLGYTPLHIAVISQQAALIRPLIKAGARLEVKSHFGNERNNGATPLHASVKAGCLDCVVALVEAGADIYATSSGITPLELAGSNVGMLRALTQSSPQKQRDEV